MVEATARRPASSCSPTSTTRAGRSTLDGEPADLHRVNYLLRGTTLPPGRHRVEFRYEPLSWRVGWIVSLLALIGLVAALVIGLRRRRA